MFLYRVLDAWCCRGRSFVTHVASSPERRQESDRAHPEGTCHQDKNQANPDSAVPIETNLRPLFAQDLTSFHSHDCEGRQLHHLLSPFHPLPRSRLCAELQADNSQKELRSPWSSATILQLRLWCKRQSEAIEVCFAYSRVPVEESWQIMILVSENTMESLCLSLMYVCLWLIHSSSRCSFLPINIQFVSSKIASCIKKSRVRIERIDTLQQEFVVAQKHDLCSDGGIDCARLLTNYTTKA